MLPHLTEVSKHMNAMGWENYANDHEDANGQFEQNWKYSDAMTTADRLILFRFMIHTLAQRDGRYATFMPKPFADRTGNGLHAHMSLWTEDTDEPLFPAGDTDSKGLGLSDLAYRFTAGLLAHAESLVAVACPIVNSYKRMGVGAPTSGATWAPAYAAYGGNNRTHMIRVPEPDRIEIRLPDGAANPYLLFAAILACGLDGVDNGMDPGDPNTDNPLHPLERGSRRPWYPDPAAHAAARRRQPGRQRRAPCRAGDDARRAVQRLLRSGQAPGVPRPPSPGDPVRGGPVPHPDVTFHRAQTARGSPVPA